MIQNENENDNSNHNSANNFPVINERKRWLFFGLPFTFTKYSLTSKSLIMKKGFFTTTEDDILLFRIMDISIRRSLFQKIVGIGTLNIASSDKSHPTIEIRNIKNVREFKNTLDERVEKERLRMRFRTGEFMGGEIDDDDLMN